MGRFDDPKMKMSVFERDRFRCRWCARTNVGLDAHHITYRRGPQDDREDNLISLCRWCHNYVHDSWQIPKHEAQSILRECIGTPGVNGLAILRQRRAREARAGK